MEVHTHLDLVRADVKFLGSRLTMSGIFVMIAFKWLHCHDDGEYLRYINRHGHISVP